MEFDQSQEGRHSDSCDPVPGARNADQQVRDAEVMHDQERSRGGSDVGRSILDVSVTPTSKAYPGTDASLL